ncbi:MAG: sulfite exporter TauE/SafE family protein, partial [Sinomicrobium sp.]|nr:sulfite exporter TauE/SafE family protein [Sinomicrobium sp.]
MTQIVQPEVAAPASAKIQPSLRKTQDSGRLMVFVHSLAFVAGFTTVFTLIGSAAGLLGQGLNQYLPTLQRLGAILLVIFALITLGVFRWLVARIHASTDVTQNPAAEALVSVLEFFNALLYTEKRVTEMHNINRGWGYASSFMLGVSFSAGWVPCVGPILASILFLASDGATAAQGAFLLAVYSLGLGIPFLITANVCRNLSNIEKSLLKSSNKPLFLAVCECFGKISSFAHKT